MTNLSLKEAAEIKKIEAETAKLIAETNKIASDIENQNSNRRLEGLKTFLLATAAVGALLSYIVQNTSSLGSISGMNFAILSFIFGVVVVGIYFLTAYVSEDDGHRKLSLKNLQIIGSISIYIGALCFLVFMGYFLIRLI
ncbi:hypothetical protein AD942_00040 [Gluconobacter japonicus]|uniref:hypothetical protein n=1 Tax=Gluconobacter TaxID=441 RepID=UPI0007822BAB|nr:hypothetical protein [Gluconobacter japonicus]KXV23555.1 hypothetical protein AD936_22460 [Gluconobacter japonicus]KXV42477.1 hypothetical protein AD942_00040 [Gluconobacter japonicus]